jgi:aminoglycoside phosphotransferase (APT) family kinase protein
LLGAEQRKTWNLSAIWRLRTPVGPVWLKEVPRFFAHEPAVLGWLAEAGLGEAAVPVLAADGTRMLLEHVDGADLHDAGLATRLAIAADMHAIHLDACARVHSLLGSGAGVPDQRGPQLARVVSAVAAGPGRGNEELARLLNGLEGRLAAAAACGLPETLIHGDLHPGNVRGTAGRRVIIDWGDSCIAHPAYDIMRLAEGLSATDASELVSFWAGLWRAVRPGSDPGAAVELLRPVAALRNAAIYANFLANIEPDEHPYHARDVGFWLERAAESVEVTGLSR